jgi:hypothetical protein
MALAQTLSPENADVRLAGASKVAAWTLQVLMAAAFVMAGGSKLAGTPDMDRALRRGGRGTVVPVRDGRAGDRGRGAAAGAGAGGVRRASPGRGGAVVAHLTVLHTPPTAPLVLLAVLTAIVFLRRREVAAGLARLRRG